MDTLSYKTISANKETAKKEWVVVDATDQVVGRLCSKVAKLIRGKYKPNFTPNVDCGDNVYRKELMMLEITYYEKKEDYDKAYELASQLMADYPDYEKGQREYTFLSTRISEQ